MPPTRKCEYCGQEFDDRYRLFRYLHHKTRGCPAKERMSSARDKRARSRSRSPERKEDSASKVVRHEKTPTKYPASPLKQAGIMRNLDSSMRKRVSIENFKQIDSAVCEVISIKHEVRVRFYAMRLPLSSTKET